MYYNNFISMLSKMFNVDLLQPSFICFHCSILLVLHAYQTANLQPKYVHIVNKLCNMNQHDSHQAVQDLFNNMIA